MVQRKKLKNKRRPKVDFIVGVEIEALYNSQKLRNIRISDYHSMDSYKLNKNFYCERDASLRNDKSYGWDTAEFISNPFLASNYEDIIKSFEQTMKRKSRTTDLKEILHFNKSMGAHVHITPLFVKNKNKIDVNYKRNHQDYNRRKKIIFSEIMNDDFAKRFRTLLRKKVKPILGPDYAKWSRHLNRSYAKVRPISECKSQRRSEWNFSSSSKNRLEYRSFNLLGVDTWEKFNLMYKAFFEALQEVFDDELDYNKPFHKEKKFSFKVKAVSNRHIKKQEHEITIKGDKSSTDSREVEIDNRLSDNVSSAFGDNDYRRGN